MGRTKHLPKSHWQQVIFHYLTDVSTSSNFLPNIEYNYEILSVFYIFIDYFIIFISTKGYISCLGFSSNILQVMYLKAAQVYQCSFRTQNEIALYTSLTTSQVPVQSPFQVQQIKFVCMVSCFCIVEHQSSREMQYLGPTNISVSCSVCVMNGKKTARKEIVTPKNQSLRLVLLLKQDMFLKHGHSYNLWPLASSFICKAN